MSGVQPLGSVAFTFTPSVIIAQMTCVLVVFAASAGAFQPPLHRSTLAMGPLRSLREEFLRRRNGGKAAPKISAPVSRTLLENLNAQASGTEFTVFDTNQLTSLGLSLARPIPGTVWRSGGLG